MTGGVFGIEIDRWPVGGIEPLGSNRLVSSRTVGGSARPERSAKDLDVACTYRNLIK